MHMLAFGGNSESLFRGAFMQSGGPFSVGKQADGQVSKFFEILFVALPIPEFHLY